MDFLTKEVVSIMMVIVAVILILNGAAIVVLGSTKKPGRYIGLVTLVGGLVDSMFGLFIIIFLIAFLR